MALICFELRMSPPDYWKLRVDEFDALIDELKIRQKQVKVAKGG